MTVQNHFSSAYGTPSVSQSKFFLSLVILSWVIILMAPYYNVIFEVGSGRWYAEEGGNRSSILVRVAPILLVTGSFIFFVAPLFRIPISSIQLAAYFLAIIMVLSYAASSLYYNGALYQDDARLTSQVTLFITSSMGIYFFPLKKAETLFRWIFILSLIFCASIPINILLFGEYTSNLPRLGAGIIDANFLSATLNLAFIFIMYQLMISKKRFVLLVLSFLVLSTGKLMTGSNGGIVGLIAMIFFALFLVKKRSQMTRLYKSLTAISLVMFFTMLTQPALLDALFSRFLALLTVDELVLAQSVGSRMKQYSNFFDLTNDWRTFLLGVSAQRIPLEIGQDLHNSILRALLAGGFLAMMSFSGADRPEYSAIL